MSVPLAEPMCSNEGELRVMEIVDLGAAKVNQKKR